MQIWQWFEDIQQDLRYGCRIFSQAPGFTTIVVLTLALGIGANTAIFSIIQAVLLRPLPYKDSAKLLAIWDVAFRGTGNVRLFDAFADFQAYDANSHSFSELAGASWEVPTQVLSGRGPARDAYPVLVTQDFFHLLGVNPALGRTFTPEDEKQACAVVLSDRFWKNSLGGEKSLIGQSIRLNDQSCTVLGVMSPEFAFYPNNTDLWTLVTSTSPFLREPNRHGIGIFARLKPGVTEASATAELGVLHKSAHVADRHARNTVPRIFALEEEFTSLSGSNLRLSLLVLFAAVAAVLLIACVNVANLLLGRWLRRQKELSIRTALGSSRARLVQQLLTENLLLSLSASAVGVIFAMAAVKYFRALNPVTLPPGKPVEVNLPVLAFTAALSISTTLIFGLLPAWKGSKADPNEVLKSGGRSATGGLSRQRIGRGLVVFEVMLSLLLLVGAGLLIRSVIRFTGASLGFSTARVFTMSMSLPPLSYPTPGRQISFYHRVLDRLAELPEVQDSALTTTLPSIGGGASGVLSTDGQPEPENTPADTADQLISGDYFRFFHIPLLRGRQFDAADGLDHEAVAIVNEALVRKYFPREEPLGKHLRFRGLQKTRVLVIVGVVADEKHFSQSQEMSWVSSPLIYRPLTQDPETPFYVLIRAATDSNSIGEVVRRRLAALDPNVPVYDLETLNHFVSQFTAYPEFRAVLLGGFACLALLLSLVGLYGVLSQLVEQRTPEIGVRVALGAQKSDVLQMVLRSGMLLTTAGVALGLLAAWGLTRFLATLLYGVESTDLMTFGGVSLLLLAAAFLAMYLPARRAANVEPVKALRYE